MYKVISIFTDRINNDKIHTTYFRTLVEAQK